MPLTSILYLISRIFALPVVQAHCDIPCGIYDSQPASLAARTVVRMVEMIKALPASRQGGPASGPTEGSQEELLEVQNSFVRMVMVKEEHAQICKKELLILWTDYFKEEHLKMFPNLHEIFWKAAKLCSQNKREVNLDLAKKLEEAVHEIGHMLAEAQKVAKKV